MCSFKVFLMPQNFNLTLFFKGNLEGLVKRRSISQEKMNQALSLLSGALDYSEFKHLDMVIEVAF